MGPSFSVDCKADMFDSGITKDVPQLLKKKSNPQIEKLINKNLTESNLKNPPGWPIFVPYSPILDIYSRCVTNIIILRPYRE